MIRSLESFSNTLLSTGMFENDPILRAKDGALHKENDAVQHKRIIPDLAFFVFFEGSNFCDRSQTFENNGEELYRFITVPRLLRRKRKPFPHHSYIIFKRRPRKLLLALFVFNNVYGSLVSWLGVHSGGVMTIHTHSHKPTSDGWRFLPCMCGIRAVPCNKPDSSHLTQVGLLVPCGPTRKCSHDPTVELDIRCVQMERCKFFVL